MILKTFIWNGPLCFAICNPRMHLISLKRICIQSTALFFVLIKSIN